MTVVAHLFCVALAITMVVVTVMFGGQAGPTTRFGFQRTVAATASPQTSRACRQAVRTRRHAQATPSLRAWAGGTDPESPPIGCAPVPGGPPPHAPGVRPGARGPVRFARSLNELHCISRT